MDMKKYDQSFVNQNCLYAASLTGHFIGFMNCKYGHKRGNIDPLVEIFSTRMNCDRVSYVKRLAIKKNEKMHLPE